MSTDIEWRWADPRGQQRLIRNDELRAALANGVIPPNAPVWRRGWREWKPADQVPELQSSALSAANGVVPNIPPPPLFVVAAQTEYEGKSVPPPKGGEDEPPPPPRYVPAEVKPPPPVFSSTPPPAVHGAVHAAAVPPAPKVPMAHPPSPKPPATGGKPAPTAKSTQKGVAPPGSGSVAPKPKPTPPPPNSTTLVDRKPAPIAIGPEANTTVNLSASNDAQAAAASAKDGESVRTVIGIPAITDPKGMAPSAAPTVPTEKRPAPAAAGAPGMKRQTLILYGAPSPSDAAKESPPSGTTASGAAPAPIVVPAPGAPPGKKNAVTRPPPAAWGGAVGIDPQIPKTAPTPKVGAAAQDDAEELSGSMILDTGEDGPVAVKPLTPSQRPPPLKPRSLPPPAPKVGASAPPPTAFPVPPAPGSGGASTTQPGIGRAPGSTPHVDPPATIPDADVPGSSVGGIRVDGPPAATNDATEPDVSGETHSPFGDEDAPLDTYPWMEPIYAKVPQLAKFARGKPKQTVPVLGGVGVFSVVILFIALVKACVGGGDDTKTAADAKGKGTRGTAAATATATATTATSTVAAVPTATPPAATGRPCTAGGASKTIASQAQVASGVEVTAGPAGIGVGFATGAKEGSVIVLAPSTLAVVSQSKVKAGDTIRRVTPIVGEKGAIGVADIDRKSDKLAGRRVAAGGGIDIGVADSSLAWAPRGSDRTTALWSLPGDGPGEALRATPLGSEKGYAVTFRRGGAIWMGVFTGEAKSYAPKGDLAGTQGLGPQVGSPAIATSGDRVLVVWADRATADDPWGLRWQRGRIGETPEPAKPFTPPGGGLGAPYMSPGVAGLGDGRFLVVWTEGPKSGHQVRALTLDARGEPQGAPLTISTSGENAGQGQVAVASDGSGVVTYLVADGDAFQVVATSVSCAQ